MAKTARELLDLPADWDSYGAQRITETAVRTAEALQFVPTSEGGIQIELYAGGVELSIELSSTGAVRAVYWESVK